jgi:hypothetical protein
MHVYANNRNDVLYTLFYVVHKLLYIVYTHNLMRNRGVINWVKKEKLRNRDVPAQSSL